MISRLFGWLFGRYHTTKTMFDLTRWWSTLSVIQIIALLKFVQYFYRLFFLSIIVFYRKYFIKIVIMNRWAVSPTHSETKMFCITNRNMNYSLVRFGKISQPWWDEHDNNNKMVNYVVKIYDWATQMRQ